jgi:hypothetical protein
MALFTTWRAITGYWAMARLSKRLFGNSAKIQNTIIVSRHSGHDQQYKVLIYRPCRYF